MKNTLAITLVNLFLMGSLCLHNPSVLRADDDINLEERSSIDPRTGDLIIDISPRDTHTRGSDNYRGNKGHENKTPPGYKARPDKKDSVNLKSGDVTTYTSEGDSINMKTGNQTLNLGGGDYIDLKTGDHIIELDANEKINVDTGERIIEVD